MWGIEAAVLALACLFGVVAIWSAPWWMRLLARVAGRVDRQMDRVEQETDNESKTYPLEEK